MFNWIFNLKNKFSILKCWMKEYFLLENSLLHLESFIERYYVLSIGFSDIYYGNENMKRFKICAVNCAFGWFGVFFFLSFIFSENMFSLIDVPSIPGKNLKLLDTLTVITMLLMAVVRTDHLIAEIKHDLKPYKVIYYLMKDLKQFHKLNEKNYKKMAILSRSIEILILDCGTTLLVFLTTLFIINVAILSGKIWWILCIIIMILIITTCTTAATSIVCLSIIMFAYYTTIFSQINNQINLISNEQATFFKRKKIINETKQRQLISLINEHNLAAIEIHKINLVGRRSIACVFIAFAMMKIVSLYLLVNFNGLFIRLFLMQFNFIVLLSGFASSYLFARQIKLAHQPLKTIHSIVCKYKMNLRFKLKVSRILTTY